MESKTFEQLGVRKEVVDALKNMGIETPTDIQLKVIEPGIEGKDVIGVSKTGSGKTLSFGAPILQHIQPGLGIQAMVLVPTRELAEQVRKEISKFAKNLNLHIISIFGGVGMGPQINGMRKADIIVATPGRMLDHLMSGNVKLKQVKSFVLDEADRMVSMGFIEDVEKILSQIPVPRQIFLFGATISEEVEQIKAKYMHNPVTKKADVFVKEEYLDQYYYNVDSSTKFSMFVHILKKENPSRAIIFCGTRVNADIITKNLQRQGFNADVLHGKMAQNKRMRIIEGFHHGKPKILVATDVAARGLHINEVSHIFNYDVPRNSEDYIHRIGRTARAGESGKAITMLSSRDYEYFDAILSRYAVDIKKGAEEQFERIRFDSRSEESSGQRGRSPMRGRGGPSFGGRGPMRGRGPSHGGGGRPPRSHGSDRHSSSNSEKKEKQHWVVTKVK